MEWIQALSKYNMQIDDMTIRLKQYDVMNMDVRVKIIYLTAWNIGKYTKLQLPRYILHSNAVDPCMLWTRYSFEVLLL